MHILQKLNTDHSNVSDAIEGSALAAANTVLTSYSTSTKLTYLLINVRN